MILDMDTQSDAPNPQSTSGAASAVPSSHPLGVPTDKYCHNSWEDDDEQAGLYDFAEELYQKDPAVEPWFLEMSRLRRIYILWLNKRLSLSRKSILERQSASDEDMEELGKVLHLQGKLVEVHPQPSLC
jgi:hypothetical protein